MTGAGGASRLDAQQFCSRVAGFLRGFFPDLVPAIIAQRMQRGGFGFGAGVAMNQMQRAYRDIELVATSVFQPQKLHLLVADGEPFQPHVAADAVFLMHDRRASLEIRQVAQDGFRVANRAPAARRWRLGANKLGFRDYPDRRVREREPLRQRSDAKSEGFGIADEA